MYVFSCTICSHYIHHTFHVNSYICYKYILYVTNKLLNISILWGQNKVKKINLNISRWICLAQSSIKTQFVVGRDWKSTYLIHKYNRVNALHRWVWIKCLFFMLTKVKNIMLNKHLIIFNVFSCRKAWL